MSSSHPPKPETPIQKIDRLLTLAQAFSHELAELRTVMRYLKDETTHHDSDIVALKVKTTELDKRMSVLEQLYKEIVENQSILDASKE